MFGKVTGRGGAFHGANEASHLKGAEPQRSPICRVLLYLYLHPITQNDHARQGHLWDRGVFLWVSPTSHPKWTGTPVFSNCGVSFYLRVHPSTQNDKIWCDKTYGEGLVLWCEPQSHTPVPTGQNPIGPQFWGFSIYGYTLWCRIVTFGTITREGGV